MKRFWTETSITTDPHGFTLLLDGRPMRLPGGDALAISSRPLADAIAAEWRAPALGMEVQVQHLPLTQLAATATLRIARQPADTAAAITAYGESDLLCYHAAEPESLVRRQQEGWQPWLDWAARRYDAFLVVTDGLGFVPQNPQSLAALAQAVALHDAHGLAALGVIVPIFGSLVLGLAVTDRALDAEEAFRLCCLDETFQEERWGQDAEAATRRRAAGEEIAIAARYFELTRSD
jgi:chaperone required for assembly of F1-ATPase